MRYPEAFWWEIGRLALARYPVSHADGLGNYLRGYRRLFWRFWWRVR
jgi:hypothetical protein